MQLINFDTSLATSITTQTKSIHATTDYDAIVVWLKEFMHSTNTLIAYKQVAEKYYLWLQYNNLMLNGRSVPC